MYDFNQLPSANKDFCVIFRTSAKCGKNTFSRIDSLLTLKSLTLSFSCEEIVCICDNVSDSQYIQFASALPYVYRTNRGNCASFRLALNIASLHPASVYYFVEDDHLHLPSQKEWINAGLEHFDFVSLYDHPDKYLLPMYADMKRQIKLTAMGHFAESPSTVMTFACRASTLQKCAHIMLRDEFTGSTLACPNDHFMFLKLLEYGYSLGTPIPGRSTHCDTGFLSPQVDWLSYLNWLRNA